MTRVDKDMTTKKAEKKPMRFLLGGVVARCAKGGEGLCKEAYLQDSRACPLELCHTRHVIGDESLKAGGSQRILTMVIGGSQDWTAAPLYIVTCPFRLLSMDLHLRLVLLLLLMAQSARAGSLRGRSLAADGLSKEMRLNMTRSSTEEESLLDKGSKVMENIEEKGEEIVDGVADWASEEVDALEEQLDGIDKELENEENAPEPSNNDDQGVSGGAEDLTEEDLEIIAEEETSFQQAEVKEVRRIGGLGVFLAISAMIFTAWQMSDHPDGVYAAACRLIITIIGLGIRILLTPCRNLFGTRHNAYHGHMPVSTMDYGYRDPSLELS